MDKYYFVLGAGYLAMAEPFCGGLIDYGLVVLGIVLLAVSIKKDD